MSIIAALVTSCVGFVGLGLWQTMINQNRVRREAKYHKPLQPKLRVIQGGKPSS